MICIIVTELGKGKLVLLGLPLMKMSFVGCVMKTRH